MGTMQCKLSDAAIKRALADQAVTAINAIGQPFELRIHKSRESASWYLVSHKKGKTTRTKLANWPVMTAKEVIARKEDFLAALAIDDTPVMDDWRTVAELLEWYRDRALADRSLSKNRKLNIKSSINKHLITCLGNELISELCEPVIDSELIWPLQSRYSLGTVRQHFALFKRAFNQAKKLNHIDANPLAGCVFTDFIDTPIKAAPGKLKAAQLPDLWQAIKAAKPYHKTLVVLMLSLATRIGETRQLRWEYIDIENRRLILPESITKNGNELILPLTEWLMRWLEQHRLFVSMHGYRGPFLFPSKNQRGCINEQEANRWIHAVSDGNWTSHHLRKLARSCWADLGIDYHVAERLLNHTMSKLDQAYIHSYVEEQKRDALNRWHDYLDTKKHALDTDTTATRTENKCSREALA